MKSFNDWMEAKKYAGTAQERTGLLKDWILKNKNSVSVTQGYGTCDDCVHVMYKDGADMWGLSHLEDYVVTSHVSGPAVILMPLDDEGLIRKEHLDSGDAYYGAKKWNKYKDSVEKKIQKGKPGSRSCHRCGTMTLEKARKDADGQWWACKNCGTSVYIDD